MPLEFPQPAVTVVLVTYNQETWVGQSIDSVLMQQTDFPFELVVLEDCSTDRTREIVSDYARRHPGRISLRLSERNDYERMKVTWLETLVSARAPLVATLEGDDFWTSADKLSRQVDFLRDNLDCSMCFHNANILDEGSKRDDELYVAPGREQKSMLSALLRGNFIPTCSVLLRRDSLRPLPNWTRTAKWTDWSTYIVAAQHGAIGYVDEVMATYRRHAGGVWSGLTKSQQLQGVIEFMQQVNAALGYRHDDLIQERLALLRGALAQIQKPE